MPSTHTPSNRLEKQAPGENSDSWGARLNDNTIELIDEGMDGVVSFTLSGSKTLTEFEEATDEARQRVLNITGGTGGTITIPNLKKNYIIINGSSGDVILTTGTGTTATVKSGNAQTVVCDGGDVCRACAVTNYGTSLITAGSVRATGTGGVGYTTGAGGTVTQGTNRDTAVTINKTCGQITTRSDSLAASGIASFTVNNSTVAAGDSICLSLVSNGASPFAIEYMVYAVGVGGGTFGITYKNLTSAGFTNALVFNFAVIKGATS